jgi:hypothetical protein
MLALWITNAFYINHNSFVYELQMNHNYFWILKLYNELSCSCITCITSIVNIVITCHFCEFKQFLLQAYVSWTFLAFFFFLHCIWKVLSYLLLFLQSFTFSPIYYCFCKVSCVNKMWGCGFANCAMCRKINLQSPCTWFYVASIHTHWNLHFL